MSPSKKEDKSRTVSKLRRLFTTTDIDEIRNRVKRGDYDPEEQEEKREVSRTVGGISDGGEHWKERWQDSMNEQTDDNTKMIYENRELLERLDERSAWTMRLLLGVFVTIIGSAALQVFIL